MTDRAIIDETLRKELEAVAEAAGCELLQVAFGGGVLRLTLDRPVGSVTLDDCATVSRQASALLDVLGFDPGRYVLEVTSPGLDRPLSRPEDYDRFTGRLARITYSEPEGRGSRTVVARLEGFDPGGGGTVTAVEEQTGNRLVLPLGQITKARLEVEI
jgi:ribosome maturation factor RimP